MGKPRIPSLPPAFTSNPPLISYDSRPFMSNLQPVDKGTCAPPISSLHEAASCVTNSPISFVPASFMMNSAPISGKSTMAEGSSSEQFLSRQVFMSNPIVAKSSMLMTNQSIDKGKAVMVEDNVGEQSDQGFSNSGVAEQSRRLIGLDHNNSIRAIVIESPNGKRYWKPDVKNSEKPFQWQVFATYDDAFVFYKKYAEKSGFSVRLGPYKKHNNVITHRYMICRKAGKPRFVNFDTADIEKNNPKRLRTYTVCDCKAVLKVRLREGCSTVEVYEFAEIHNHDLCSVENVDLSKSRRQLTFYDQHFIRRLSLSKVGPRVAHRLQSSLRGGAHNMRGTENDYVNFSRDVHKFIGNKDAKMFCQVLEERSVNLPNFSFEYALHERELKSAFWADDVSKINYQQFGDVLAFDATYHTNKYDMIFVPFTGVDHHKRCVTFGAGLLSSESVDSYTWLLQRFLLAHPKPSTLILSDQDPALHQATPFSSDRHRCLFSKK